MNDPNKVIDVNLSSLLSLKAELLRKQQEVSKTKATRPSADEYVAKKTTSQQRGEHKSKPKKLSTDGDAIIYEHEDSALLEKSQRILQAKSKFYERMTKTGGNLNSDDNCLVLFNRKHQEEVVDNPDKDHPQQEYNGDSDSDSSSSDDDVNNGREDPKGAASDDDENWVEYTDCLGRTRKCLREDLADAKRRDAELARSMPERLDQTKPNWMLDTKGSHDDAETNSIIGPLPTDSIFNDGCSLMSKHDEQRANWERKEIENLEKTDVHYQDVFFDEARQHGVAYYAFSTDEEERKQQQRELQKSRDHTISEQQRRDALRVQREKIIAERVRAAKNRQRARLGLPPLEDDEVKESENVEKPKEETKKERKARKRAEKLKRKQEEEEQQRELERQQHIRPWDREKGGVKPTNNEVDNSNTSPAIDPSAKWLYRPERGVPMSQEEWNERKRAERNAEFAPTPEMHHPPPAKMKRTNFSTTMPPPPVPAQPPKNYNLMPPPLAPQTLDDVTPDTFSSYQSTKREKSFYRRNYIDNDNADNDDSGRGGVTIPPPANLTDADTSYTLPQRAKKSKSNIDLERSIDAGLRFLRNNCDKTTKSTKSSWTAKADY